MGIGFFAGMLDKDAMTSVTGTTGLKQSVTSNFVSSTKNITDEQWKRIQKIILRIAEYDQLGIMPSGTTGAFYKVGHHTYQHLHYRVGPYRLYLAYSADAKEVILGDFLSKNDTSRMQNFFDQQLPSVYKDDHLLTGDQGEAFIRDHGLSLADQPLSSKPSVQQLPLGDLVQHYNELSQAKSLSETIAELPAIGGALEIALIILNHHPHHLKVAADKLQQQGLVGSDQRGTTIKFLLVLKSIQNRLVALVEEELQKPMPDWPAMAQLWEKWDFEDFQSSIKADIKVKVKSTVDRAVANDEDITRYKDQFEPLGDLGQNIIDFIEEQQEVTIRHLEMSEKRTKPALEETQPKKTDVTIRVVKKSEMPAPGPDQQKIKDYKRFKAMMHLLHNLVANAAEGLPIAVNLIGNYGKADMAKGPISKIDLPNLEKDTIGMLVTGGTDDSNLFYKRLTEQKDVLKQLPRLVFGQYEIKGGTGESKETAGELINKIMMLLAELVEQDVAVEELVVSDINQLYPAAKALDRDVLLGRIRTFISRNRSTLKKGVDLVAIAGSFASLKDGLNEDNIVVDDIYRCMNIIVFGSDSAVRNLMKKMEKFFNSIPTFPKTIIYINSNLNKVPALGAVVHHLFADRQDLRGKYPGVEVLFQEEKEKELEDLLPTMPYTVIWDEGKEKVRSSAKQAKSSKKKSKRRMSMIGAVASMGILIDAILLLSGIDTGRGLGTLVSVVPVGYFLMRLPLLVTLFKQGITPYGRDDFYADLRDMKQAGLTIPGWPAWNQWINGESDLYPSILSQVALKTTNLSWWKLVLWGGSLAHVVQQNGALSLSLPRHFTNLSQGQRISLLAHEFYHLSRMEERNKVTVIAMQPPWWTGLKSWWDELTEELMAIRVERAASRTWKPQERRLSQKMEQDKSIKDLSGQSLTGSGPWLVKWLNRMEDGSGVWEVLRVITRPLLWTGWQLVGLYMILPLENRQGTAAINDLEKASLILSDDWSALKFKSGQVHVEPLPTPSNRPWGSYRFDGNGRLIIGVPLRLWPGKRPSALNKTLFELVVRRQAREAFKHAFEPIVIVQSGSDSRLETAALAQKVWIRIQLAMSNLLPQTLATIWRTQMMKRRPMAYLVAKLHGVSDSELAKTMNEAGSQARKAYCNFVQNPAQGSSRLLLLLLETLEEQKAALLASGNASPKVRERLLMSTDTFEVLFRTWSRLSTTGSNLGRISWLARYNALRRFLNLPPSVIPDHQPAKPKPVKLSLQSAA